MANHLGDLGALGNDAGFAFGLAQFSRLKEQLLRASHEALGAALSHGRHRAGRDAPGSCANRRCSGSQRRAAEIADEVLTLRAIYDEHEGVRDRFSGAGAVAPELGRTSGAHRALRAARAARRSICAATCPASRMRSSRQ